MKLTEVKLKDISKNNRGYYGIGAPAVDYDKNKYTYLRITDINDDGTLNKTALKSVDDENAFEFLLKKNDIVFARTGASTGRNYFYDGEINNLVFAGFLIKFSLDEEKVNPRFIKYYCLSQNYKNWIDSSLTGSTRPNINEKQLSEMPIILPDREYQDRVVKVLDAITKKIELNSQINNNLFNISQNLYNNYIKINQDIHYCKIRDLNYKLETGKRPSGGVNNIRYGIPSIGAESIKGIGNFDFSKTKYVPESFYSSMKKGIIKGYEILIYKDGGKPGYFIPNFSMFSDIFPYKRCVINEHVFLLDFYKKRYNIFAYYYFNSEEIRHKLHILGSNSAAIPGINQQNILELKIPILENENINSLIDILEVNTEAILKNSYQNFKLNKLRDTLLPKLINEEIDLDKIEI